MKKLDHPFIVKVHGFSECPIGFVMDYIDGPNLLEFSGGMESAAEKVRVLHAIAKTLQYAHRREVVHRDVKPQNIVMQLNEETREWEPFLMDFDLAWYPMAKGQLTLAGGKGMGTLNYSAPEQLQGGHPSEVRAKTTDSYAFGQLAYFVIVNEDPQPYAAEKNAVRLRKKIRDSFYAEPASHFVGLYEKCSLTDPRGRPSFDEITASLAYILQLLSELGTRPVINVAEFTREILFSMLISPDQGTPSDNYFLTQSGRFRIAIEVREQRASQVDLTFDFWAQQKPASAASYKKAHQSIMAKIGAAVTKENAKAKGAVTLRPGSQSPFQMFLDYRSIPLNISGVKVVTDFLRRMIEIADDF
jgi:serine/threonine protein kinase